MRRKVYVDVIAKFQAEDGTVIPWFVIWDDGSKYEVDRVLDVRPAASLKAGGAGIRYTIRVLGQQTYLWREEDKWFVEGKTS